MFTKDFPHSVNLSFALEMFFFFLTVHLGFVCVCVIIYCGRGADRAASLAQLE